MTAAPLALAALPHTEIKISELINVNHTIRPEIRNQMLITAGSSSE